MVASLVLKRRTFPLSLALLTLKEVENQSAIVTAIPRTRLGSLLLRLHSLNRIDWILNLDV